MPETGYVKSRRGEGAGRINPRCRFVEQARSRHRAAIRGVPAAIFGTAACS